MRPAPCLATLVFLSWPDAARAEGTATLGVNQALRAGTVLYVDIMDPARERISWTGTGVLTVTRPDGTAGGSLTSGGSLVPTTAGAWKLTVGSAQSRTTGWDVTVAGATLPGGRLFSYNWQFDAGSFASTAATSASVYAKVPGGDGVSTAVIEMQLAGLAGYVYDLNANRTGVDGTAAGRSVEEAGHTVSPEFPLYLAPPTTSDYRRVLPSVGSLSFEGAQATAAWDGSALSCDAAAPGFGEGAFRFTSDAVGTWHLQCDLDHDGNYSIASGLDLFLVGETTIGDNLVPWGGYDALGTAVVSGTYDCRVKVTVGEFHYVGRDIETSYPGLRLYDVAATGLRTPLPMYWNDAEVQYKDVRMPNGVVGLLTPGELGLLPGAYGTAAVPNADARSWGAFAGNGKGNQSFLDTFVWLVDDVSTTVTVDVLDGAVDGDADGLSDFDERCTFGTVPSDPDTDGDGVLDGVQYGTGSSSSTSGGGLESTGDFAAALAVRRVQAVRARGSLRSAPTRSVLDELVPAVGPRGSVPVRATPSDLPSVTNAVDVAGFDYRDPAGRIVAGVLLIETRGELYAHTKGICDRAGGARLSGFDEVQGSVAPWVSATLVRPGGPSDHSLSFALYEDAAGAYVVASSWLVDGLPVPAPGARVVQVQVWSAVPGDAESLAEALLAGVGAPAWTGASPHGPAAWVVAASTLGGDSAFEWVNTGWSSATLWASVREEDDTISNRSLGTLTGPEGRLALELPPFREATVDVLVDGVPVDRVWLSDGTWVGLSDASFGGSTALMDLQDRSCARPGGAVAFADETGLPSARALAFSGCGSLRADVDQWAGVVRTFARPIAVDGYDTMVFWHRSTVGFSACLESEAAGFVCAPVAASPEGAWVALDRDDFVGDDPMAVRSSVDLATFMADRPGTLALEVAGLAFVPGRLRAEEEPAVPTCGCATATGGSGPVLLLGLLALRRRREDGPGSTPVVGSR